MGGQEHDAADRGSRIPEEQIEDGRGQRFRWGVVLPLVVGLAGLAFLPSLLLKAEHDGWHWNDLPFWPEAVAATPFDPDAPLYCTGIERMSAARAVDWLEGHGYQTVVFEARPDDVLLNEEVPANALLRQVEITEPGRGTVEITTPGHPEHGGGYQGRVPPQDC